MNYGITRYLVAGLIVLSLLGGVAVRAASASGIAQNGGISGASTVIFSEDKLGGVSLNEASGYDKGAYCKFTSIGNGIVNMGNVNKPTVWAKNHSKQDVRVGTSVYQKLANGTLDVIWNSSSTKYTVTATHLAIDPVDPPALPAGPTYVLAYYLDWYDPNYPNAEVTEGREVIGYTDYWRFVAGQTQTTSSESNVCNSFWAPYAKLINTSGTVGSTINFYIYRFPIDVTAYVRYDGVVIGSVHTNSSGEGAGSVKVPASIMGPHTLKFSYGSWVAQATYTVKPRIKVTPNTVSRGQVVNVSLRGYKGYEPVKIRWKKGDSFVQVAQVTTSSTGSANVNVVVPSFVPDGTTSVRGDGVYGHAQTNAVTVSGGPFNSSTAKTPTATATPTSTATATPATPELTPTAPIETATPEPTETASPTAETPVTDETATPEPSPTVTAEPTDTPTATDEPSSPTPTETPTVEATTTP
jgi:hypothetical protein